MPRLRVREASDPWIDRARLLEVELEFEYEGEAIAWNDERAGIYKTDPPRLLRRDTSAEQQAIERIRELGVREETAYSVDVTSLCLVIPQRLIDPLVHTLASDGWAVEAIGRVYRPADGLDLDLTSGIDWFGLHGNANFGDQTVELPRLLKALRRGDTSVQLADGSHGVLPADWLERYGSLADLGELGQSDLRFQPNQIGLLDSLLTSRPEIEVDPTFARAREKLASFFGVAALKAPSSFVGELRGYQRDGLGWLHFLREIGFGGCLADDMGLGKTVQVLALLESRRQLRQDPSTPDRQRPEPSLVVVPKSLMFNWRREAERFTPKMRLLDYAGTQRKSLLETLGDYDIVLTTYGTLRRDIDKLEKLTFDYAVLDEAQAIKNHKSATAKAARRLRSHHRLALTGTPVENHAGELMSILDFLNPGLFGPGRKFELPRGLRDGAVAGDGTLDPQLELIAGASRPFTLRRTKARVAKDLPPKVEQVLYCELPPAQRKDYDQLREHYRRMLLGQVDKHGLPGSKMHVLEALLRLRQAACHAGLVDPERRDEDSGKLAMLLPQLDEIHQEGHKALVFSQFTSMLSIVRSKLEARGLSYEYLDGSTRDREQRVERFQNDPDCRIFLISLKAGGLGLNLTAAEYVFLLDPWWNPAVEAQAIDRTHRIGQTRNVFAYSLIAQDTVEEKVLELQRTKRELASAIVRADSGLIKNLTRDDLVQLLS